MPTPPKFITRYRVKNGPKQWNDQGPDLLRPRIQAKSKLRDLLADEKAPMWVQRRSSAEWKRVGGKLGVMQEFETWLGDYFKVAVRDGDGFQTVAVVKRERVPYIILNNCSPQTCIFWSVFHYQFPDALFAGGYVYKQVEGSASWSDHAWGTAVDITRKGNVSIRDLTDYASRMAQANCIKFDYALGSFNGEDVVYVNGQSGETRPSSASDSHTWHLHTSIVDHDGKKPPREGGVW